ncbi:FecR family protein [Puteibacter caeruleilacunae]|nr:FecR family protein [Puteibacter caeruleilacunae]
MSLKDKHIEIASLIAKSVTGSIDDSEKKRLQVWLQEEENTNLFNEVADADEIFASMDKHNQVDVQKGKAGLLRKLEQQREPQKPKGKIISFNWMRYVAASVILLFSVGLYFVISHQLEKDEVQVVETAVVPGTGKAILSLSDGEKVELSTEKKVQTIKGREVEIMQNSSSISYEKLKHETKKGKKKLLSRKNTLTVPKGGEWMVVLSDGTKVWLNSDTKLVYPVQFGEDERRVHLYGEAYFEVAHNKDKPFVVATKTIVTKVLGTQFNIKSYCGESEVQTTLVEGSVAVSSKANDYKDEMILTPNHQAIFDRQSKTITTREVDCDEFIAWKSGYFDFEDQPLELIMNSLSRWYDLNVSYENETVKGMRFSVGKLKRYDDFSAVIQLFEKTNRVKMTINGKNINVSTKTTKKNK